jgi:hypothetical protein
MDRRGGSGSHQPRDLDLAIAVLDLDLGQTGFSQHFGQFAHQRGIDVHAARPASALCVAHAILLDVWSGAYARGRGERQARS